MKVSRRARNEYRATRKIFGFAAGGGGSPIGLAKRRSPLPPRAIATALLLFLSLSVSAQRYPERREVRAGNRAYEQGEFVKAEEHYRAAGELGVHNLGSALYRQERFAEAAEAFGDAHYNKGNALFGERKLEEALESYKEAMRNDPADMDAKFNYAYVKKLLEKSDDDQPQEQPEEQPQGGQGEQGGGDDGQEPQGGGMSRADAEAMLDALAAQERTETEGEKRPAATATGKNW